MLVRPIATGGAWTPPIEQSLIFDGAAYLSWTPGVASTSRRVGSLALWYRRAEFGVNDRLFSSRLDSSNYLLVEFQSNDTMRVNITIGGTSYVWVTNAVYRDIGWQHLLMTWDTTTQTFALLHNGVARTFSSSATLPLNGDTAIFHNGARQTLGAWYDGVGHSEIFHGAIADVHGVDGTALANADTFIDGVVFDGQTLPAPKAVTGLTYGTNGFHLAFADTSAFGDDTSGNTNDWTPTGFVAGDQSQDVPGRPYAVWNGVDTFSAPAIQEGGRRINGLGAGDEGRANLAFTTGKFYAEFAFATSVADGNCAYGIAQVNRAFVGPSSIASTPSWVWMYRDDGQMINNGAGTGGFTNYGDGQRLAIAVDADAGDVWFGLISGSTISWEASGDPAAGTGAQFTSVTVGDGLTFYANFANGSAGTTYFDLVTDPALFAAAPPTGFLPLHAGNLPTPTADGRNYFAANIRTGTGAAYSVTNGPANGTDFVWAKGRSGATDHALYDILRGVQQQLESNTTTAETTEATGLTAFNATGYTAGALAQMNTSAATYVDWMWKAGGAGVANTDGTISSTVSVAAAGHFGIAVFNKPSSTAITFGHGLGAAYELGIFKNRGTGSTRWVTYHKDVFAGGSDRYLDLSSTSGFFSGSNPWNSTAPNATVGSLGTDGGFTGDIVAYLFRSIPGLCKVGNYPGNGSADGPLIDLGFKARWVLFKRTNAAASWVIHDTARSPQNVRTQYLLAEAPDAEYSSGTEIDVLADGFKIRTSGNTMNNSGSPIIYLAMADIAGGGDLPWPLAA